MSEDDRIVLTITQDGTRGAVEVTVSPNMRKIIAMARAGHSGAGYVVGMLTKVMSDSNRMTKEQRSRLILPPGMDHR